jgi:hypothetical protein
MIQTTSIITEELATGEDIKAIVEVIEPTLEGLPKTHIVMACLSIVFAMMDSDMESARMQEGVRGASEWICNYIAKGSDQVIWASKESGMIN